MSSDTKPCRCRATLLTHRSFLLFLLSRSLSRFSSQIAAVAIGWQIYDLTGSAFDLGMVGLVQFLPTALLVFVAGHAADRYERKRVVQLCQLAEALTALFLAWSTYAGWLTEVQIFIADLRARHRRRVRKPGDGGAAAADRAAGFAAARHRDLERRGAGRDHHRSGARRSRLCGGAEPALRHHGGVLAARGAPDRRHPHPQAAPAKESATPDDLFAGVRFVRNNPAILGTISLDLFAVLFGGVTALLPIYARDILETGPLGLGILRAAPAVGALLMTMVLARHTINRRVGMRMFQAVIVFGVATVVFALSHWMWLSVLALAILGAADTVSVVIRFSLVQLATPDEMRGRVGAVNFLFINASNQLGQFESGVTAALFGAMPAAVLGGVGTIAIALLWMKLFPTLRKWSGWSRGRSWSPRSPSLRGAQRRTSNRCSPRGSRVRDGAIAALAMTV